ncbi:hypothetical protein MES4922_140048 [Mesorhizobium ventifaucium]|uniref:Uncharacterized protein n=1 Tax=Mesorhizobium ventifaucium TaxID=666020 RepID=A0ABN8JE36_9HYPH|nr:hypothetical protein MES4922_140048 [Mesorhizobium ventifaucium]
MGIDHYELEAAFRAGSGTGARHNQEDPAMNVHRFAVGQSVRCYGQKDSKAAHTSERRDEKPSGQK